MVPCCDLSFMNRFRQNARGKRGRRDADDCWSGRGGYMAVKRAKLDCQFVEGIDKKSCISNIFSGISIYVNGYTEPCAADLRNLMRCHGGRYEHYYTLDRVTHIIASELPKSKRLALVGSNRLVVRPQWLLDSVRAGRKLALANYLLCGSNMDANQHYRLDEKAFFETNLNLYNKNSKGTTTESPSDNIIAVHESDSEDSLEALLNLADESEEIISANTKFNQIIDNDDGRSSQNACISPNTSSNCEIPLFNDKDNGRSAENYCISPNTSSNCEIPFFNDDGDGRSAKNACTSPKTTYNCEIRSSATTGGAVSQFFTRSRLHHISQWAAECREYVDALRNLRDVSSMRHKFHGREALQRRFKSSNCPSNLSDVTHLEPTNYARCIMHIDMDCFFVSAALLKRPELRGLPVAVTHCRDATVSHGSVDSCREWEAQQYGCASFGNGSMAELASCSYEARALGVRNGMLVGQARQLCPNLVLVPFEFEHYRVLSRKLYDTVASFTHDIEAVSCDELLVDCTDLLLSIPSLTPLLIAAEVRAAVHVATGGCTASCGLGSNPLLARLATRRAKPDGAFCVPPGAEAAAAFVADLAVGDLPGVGRSIERRLASLGVQTCAQLTHLPLATLCREFGPRLGRRLSQSALGQDQREALQMSSRQRHSVSVEVNYGIRFESQTHCDTFLKELCDELAARLNRLKLRGRALTVKIMTRRPDAPRETAKFGGHGVCNTLTRTVTFPLATENADLFLSECRCVLRAWGSQAEPHELRGLGLQMGRLESASSKSNAVSHVNEKSDKAAPSILDYAQKMERFAPVKLSNGSRLVTRIPPDQLSEASTVPRSFSAAAHRITASQVDPTVLAELPLDILHEVQQEFIDIPSVSHSASIIEELPSFSQLDPTCLEALPSNIRAELQSAYAAKSRTKSTCSKSRVKSPLSKPRRAAATARNGRTRGSHHKQLTLLEVTALSNNRLRAATPTTASTRHNPLIGATYDEIRATLRDWISGCVLVSTEVETCLFEHLGDSFPFDLERICWFLRVLRRLCDNASPAWRDLCLRITETAQRSIHQHFGAIVRL